MGFEAIVSAAGVVGVGAAMAGAVQATIRARKARRQALEQAAERSLRAAGEWGVLRGDPVETSVLPPLVTRPQSSLQAQPQFVPPPLPQPQFVPPALTQPTQAGSVGQGYGQAPIPVPPRPNIDSLQAREYFQYIGSAKRQSTAYFWTYLISGVLGVSALLGAAALAVFGSRDIALFTTICGALPTGISALFYARAGDVDKAARENLALLDKAVENAKRTKAARDVAARLPPGPERDRILSMIAMRQLFPDAAPADLAVLLPESNHGSADSAPATPPIPSVD
ncbi:hypothetical protein JMUB6875_10150 [Nocardia sp. JMUB6875]|uniref:TRADD-N-associated membrane domain-containing protein n=1 Tax=Nocardia sp. JMUB6875 TaxID=3158170 RepID=UPI0032E5FFDE